VTDADSEHLTVEGRCLCGAARYEVEGKLQGLMLHCHCQRCRKHYGSIFASFVGFVDGEIRWLEGSHQIDRFTSKDLSGGRTFCRICGSTMPNPGNPGPLYGCSAGNILDMPPSATTYYFYLGGSVPWYEPPKGADHLYEVVHPDYRDPGLDDLDRSCTPGKICGSCLCGDVAFEAANPLIMMNCHCSRCRLSRASAHATNLFVSRNDFSWQSGQENVVDFKLPDADRFGSAFCKRCGSLVPRRAGPDGERMNIPAGCLDSYPAISPSGHIHVASKARWFEITDSLPRWETVPHAGQRASE
jgi:hypothetical protein